MNISEQTFRKIYLCCGTVIPSGKYEKHFISKHKKYYSDRRMQ